MNTRINAENAKDISNANVEKQIDRVMKDILKAAEEGKCEARIVGISSNSEKYLTDSGFEVCYDFSKMFQGSAWSIKWDKPIPTTNIASGGESNPAIYAGLLSEIKKDLNSINEGDEFVDYEFEDESEKIMVVAVGKTLVKVRRFRGNPGDSRDSMQSLSEDGYSPGVFTVAIDALLNKQKYIRLKKKA